MLASSIHSMLHLVQNTSDYEPLYSDLMALHVRIRRLVPKEAGLLRRPPRPGRKLRKHGLLRQRRRYRKAKRKNVPSVKTAKEQASTKPRIVPLDSTFDESSTADTVRNAEPSRKGPAHPTKEPAPSASLKSVRFDDPSTVVTDSEHDVTDPLTGQADSSNSLRQKAETASWSDVYNYIASELLALCKQKINTVLQQILNTPPTDRPIVQIGPYTITDSSMHYLNSTLSDEVIDSCLHLMVNGNVRHIDCANMTAIFDTNGSQDSTSYLPTLQLQRYDALLGAVNEGGDHWVLMIIIPGAKKLVYMNPLGELTAKIRAYECRWCMFLTERCQRGIEMETMGPDGWNVETVPHSKQLDSYSCGIYVIKFAEQHLSGKDENVLLTSKCLEMERRRIQLQLLSSGIQEQEMLALSVRQTSERDLELVGQEATLESEQHKEICRKRKRKDERKSSIFVYKMPKKTSRKTKSCVCRQKDDRRKYWNCEGCDEWYHPECMGQKVKEEPDIYICPGCQVKNNEQFEKDCPSLSEVEEELLESIRVEEADQFDESFVGELQEHHSGLTPVSLNNPAVQFFVDIQKQNGQIIEIKETGWGPFILFTDDTLDDFFSFKNNLNINELFTFNVALRFFINEYDKKIKVMHVSEKVVRLYPVHAVDKYREWLQQMKDRLSS